MKYFIALILVLVFAGCFSSALKLENVEQFKGISQYKLTDGKISITYASSMCPCIAREVLEEVKRRVDTKELDWLKMADEQFAIDYLDKICKKMLKK